VSHRKEGNEQGEGNEGRLIMMTSSVASECFIARGLHASRELELAIVFPFEDERTGLYIAPMTHAQRCPVAIPRSPELFLCIAMLALIRVTEEADASQFMPNKKFCTKWCRKVTAVRQSTVCLQKGVAREHS
jgi:hypothetical protein